jgi:outer membrane usher protein
MGPAVGSTQEAEPLPYSVEINGQASGDALLLRLPNGALLAHEDDWIRWRLKLPTGQPYVMNGERYWNLGVAPGFAAKMNPQLQRAQFQFAAAAFSASVYDLNPRKLAAAQPSTEVGGFLNYEAVGTHNAFRDGGEASSVNAGIEGGFFNARGVATSQWLGLNLDESADEGVAGATARRRILRLDTSWRSDFPDEMTTLQVGDAVGGTGLWGRPARFGGIQWARNFSTQPGFVTLPQPSVRGESALPSVLDLYVDGIRRRTLETPPGPFTVENVPVLNGQGQVEVVVRDFLGREFVLTQPYSTTSRQLRQGLHDFSYEIGFVRENFGRTSDDYGRLVATGVHRYGFDDALTGEVRAELRESDSGTVGLGAILGAGDAGIFSSAAALSAGDGNTGGLGLVGWERIMRRRLSLGLRGVFTSRDFEQTGLAEGARPASRQVAANVGFALGRQVNVGFGYVNQHNRTPATTTEAVTGTVTTRLGFASLAFRAIERFSPDRDYTLAVYLAVPLQYRTSGSAGYDYQRDEAGAWSGRSSARVQRNIPDGEGWGYRAALLDTAGTDGSDAGRGEVGAGVNLPYGTYVAEASVLDAVTSYRGTVSGGFGALGDRVFASRKILNSFGIVDAGTADIAVYVNNQLSGRTDSAGRLVLPNLLAYQGNSIRIDADELPMDYEAQQTEVTGVPYFRSGIVIPMNVRRSLSALIVVHLPDGRPLPPGAVARLQGQDRDFPVGKNGQIFVSGLQTGPNDLSIDLAEGPCTLRVEIPEGIAFQASLGPFRCAQQPN